MFELAVTTWFAEDAVVESNRPGTSTGPVIPSSSRLAIDLCFARMAHLARSLANR